MGDGAAIKTMKLYSRVERIHDELRHIGIGEDDPLTVADLLPFDQIGRSLGKAGSTREYWGEVIMRELNNYSQDRYCVPILFDERDIDTKLNGNVV